MIKEKMDRRLCRSIWPRWDKSDREMYLQGRQLLKWLRRPKSRLYIAFSAQKGNYQTNPLHFTRQTPSSFWSKTAVMIFTLEIKVSVQIGQTQVWTCSYALCTSRISFSQSFSTNSKKCTVPPKKHFVKSTNTNSVSLPKRIS